MAIRTFLFTDIEGSTRLWQSDPEGMRNALAIHDSLVERSVIGAGGLVFKHTGDGVAAVFESPASAIEAAVDIVAGASDITVDGETMCVRAGLHAGEAESRGGDWFGLTVNRASRVMGVAHGGQILVSETVASLSDPSILTDLGEHRLRDLHRPERLAQVVAPGLRTDFPPLATLDRIRNNLPVIASSFVGRAGEIADVTALVESSRVVTVTGVGGAGKTRLALQVAADVSHGFDGGVWFVPLASHTDPALVATMVASALGVEQSRDGELIDAIVDQLGAGRTLLVLDNCEHLIDAVATLVARLVERAPALYVLATSRELLAIPGETAYGLRSLSLPGDGDGSPQSSDAIALFVERARSVAPGFVPTDDDIGAVSEICRRLDGMPLAIELAAARIRTFSPRWIAEHLDERFRLLTGGSRTALPRQQTLSAAVEWSYRLLDDAEQAFFRRLSVFVGGFDFEAARAVCPEGPVDEGSVIELLPGLVDKSLVMVERGGRYHLLETLRQFGRDRVDEADEGPALRRRHAEHFAELGDALRIDDLRGPDSEEVTARLSADIENLRAGAVWAIERGDPDTAVRIWWLARAVLGPQGRFREQIPLLARLVELDGSEPFTAAAARAALGAAMVNDASPTDGIPVLEGAVDDFRALLERLTPRRLDEAAVALNALALAEFWFGRAGERNERYLARQVEMLAWARMAGSKFTEALALANLAHHREPTADPDETRRLFDEAERASIPLGAARMAGLASQRGLFEFGRGDLVEARRRFATAARLTDELGWSLHHAQAAAYEALCAVLAGDAAAVDRFDRSVAAGIEAPEVLTDYSTLRGMAAGRAIVAGKLRDHETVGMSEGVARRLEELSEVTLLHDLAGAEAEARTRARTSLGASGYDEAVARGRSLEGTAMLDLLARGR